MPEKDLAAEPLIDREDDSSRRNSEELLEKLIRQYRWLKTFLIIAYLPAIVLLVLSSFRWLGYWPLESGEHSTRPDLIPSPIQSDALQWETRKFAPDYHGSPYAGDPSPELDLAWHWLFEDNDIRVDKEDLDRVDLKSVELVDGGYVAQLGVFHELHCLKKIRHWIFKEYYVLPKNLSREELEEWPAHINHCIEMLRLSIMCKGDTSLSTYGWIGPPGRRVPSAWDRAPHQCVVWDSLVDWNRARSVNMSAPGSIFDEEGKVYYRGDED